MATGASDAFGLLELRDDELYLVGALVVRADQMHEPHAAQAGERRGWNAVRPAAAGSRELGLLPPQLRR